MIPITRKDHYLNEIVGWGDTAPEKPYIEEEFFFAEILGEAVQAPEPLTRYQMYLAKIAGRDIEIPYPETRLEYFLAKAAGMDITVPAPITREEIYWSNYTAIVEFEIENTPPLTYKAIEGTLKNYRIYGNTVDGESVGDLITEGEHAGEYRVPVTVANGTDTETTNIYLSEQIRKVGNEAEYVDYKEQKQHRVRKNLLPNADWVEGYITGAGGIAQPSPSIQEITSPFVKVIPGKTYVFSYYPNEGEPWRAVIYYTEDKRFIKRQSTAYSASSVAFTVESGVGYVRFSYRSYGDGTFSQLELGDTVTDYEPYIENTDLDVTLPALPTLPGTNVLSVGTAVQPSKVYIKYKGERQ